MYLWNPLSLKGKDRAMIEFFKYLRGYVCIRVTGFSPERFMNLCGNREILLWNIRKEQDAYYMCISIAGFYQLRPIVKKTGTRVAIVKRCGLPFFMPGMWKRKVFLMGFFLAAAFWIWTSRYIWAIEIQGNFTITEDVLMDYLKEEQIYTGMKKSSLDIETLEKNIRKEFYRITWTSAKLEGTKLTIQVKENELLEAEMEHEKEQEEEKTACDLVADRDGKIVSMIVREGVPQAAIGQEVKKGDILVSGSVPIYQEDGTVRKYRYCKADADIMLEHTITLNQPLSLFYEKKSYTGREKKQYYLNIVGKTIDFFGKKKPFVSYDTVTGEKKLRLLNDFYLPVIFGKHNFREYYVEEQKYTSDEANKILTEEYKKFMETLAEKGVQIIEKNVKIEKTDSTWILHGIFRVYEKTGISIPIEEKTFENEEACENGL